MSDISWDQSLSTRNSLLCFTTRIKPRTEVTIPRFVGLGAIMTGVSWGLNNLTWVDNQPDLLLIIPL